MTDHPPVVAGLHTPGPSMEVVAYAHAALWLDLHLDEWGVWRRGHLHLVRRLEDPDDWRLVDMAHHPLAPASDCTLEVPEGIRDELLAWLGTRQLVLYRAPSLGAVSELGEDAQGFRARLLALMQPEVARGVAAAGGGEKRRELAAAVARLVGEIEERTVPDITTAIRHLELGLLLTASGVQLEDSRYTAVLNGPGTGET